MSDDEAIWGGLTEDGDQQPEVNSGFWIGFGLGVMVGATTAVLSMAVYYCN